MEQERKIKIALCDDMPAYCNYLTRVFEHEDDMEVIGCANSAKECLQLFLSFDMYPDILLLDNQMEKSDSGAQIIPEVLKICPDVKIIMLTVHHEDKLIFQSFVNGAVDYALKSSSDEEILNIIRNAYNNTTHLKSNIYSAIIKESSKLKTQNTSLMFIINTISKLTTSEFKILEDLCNDLTYKDIAKKRVVEEITIRSQVSRIIKKFNMPLSDIIAILNDTKFFKIFNE